MPSALSKHVPSETGQTWLIGGHVQGVGFRPFVSVMATELGVRGSVRNRGSQVEIVAIGDRASVELLLRRLLAEHPPIARPELIAIQSCTAPANSGFRILPSGCGDPGGAVLPDQSTCEACLTEMADRLHSMRAPLYDHSVAAIRPRDDRHGGIFPLQPVPSRIRAA